jgi:aldehyde:ferredoxin oxidoreductase
MEDVDSAGARIFMMEKMFNYREGFRREDDTIPEKFFNRKFSYGEHAGAIVDRDEFNTNLDKYYESRNWDPVTSRPEDWILKEAGLEFTI